MFSFIMVRLFSWSSFFTKVRKFVFLDFESIAIICVFGFVMEMSMQGSPDPEPRSSVVVLFVFGISFAILIESSI